jgi:hypothetical protein
MLQRSLVVVLSFQAAALLAAPAYAEGPSAPLPSVPVWEPPPAPPTLSAECKWGRSRSGCRANPAIVGTVFSALAVTAALVGTASFTAGGSEPGGVWHSRLALPALVSTGGAALFAWGAGLAWWDHAHRVRPSAAASRAGASIGLTGSF